MKRLHLHIAVKDVEESVRFYSILFGTRPTVTKSDYAKWMLDDPHVNFAISTRGKQPGLDHLGVQVDDECELAAVADRLRAAGRPIWSGKGVECCYARSDKAWVVDPQGLAWETFRTFGEQTVYGETDVSEADLAALAPPATPAQSAPCCGCGQ